MTVKANVIDDWLILWLILLSYCATCSSTYYNNVMERRCSIRYGSLQVLNSTTWRLAFAKL